MRYALVIGNSQYSDPKLAQLKTPEADSRELAKVLRSKRFGNYDKVILLMDQTEAKIRRSISAFLSNKKPDDLVLLYFSGHGVLDGRGNLFLASKDTEMGTLNATAISSSFISYELDNCRSKRQILILDCCNSGAFARGTKGPQKAITESTFEGSGSGRVVLTASDSTQFAFEGDRVIAQSSFSLFTHFLLEGLKTGRADRDQDGQVSLDEWYDYCHARITATTPQQVPHKWSYRQQGDLIIAQNPYAGRKVPPKVLQLRAMLDQKQKDFQQHGLFLDSIELSVIEDELERTRLELQEADKRLILLSAVIYDDGQKWLDICGGVGLEWLHQAYQDGKMPQKVRLGAVRFLGQIAGERIFNELMDMIGKDSEQDEAGLDLLAQYVSSAPNPPELPWKLRRLLFPRLLRLSSEKTLVQRSYIIRGVAILVPTCVIILFSAFYFADLQTKWTFLELALVFIFSSVGIIAGTIFVRVATALVLLRKALPVSWLLFALLVAGGLIGIPLFSAITGSTEIWKASAGIGALLAAMHLFGVWKQSRYWVYLSPFLAIGATLLVFNLSVSSPIAALGESLSAGLFTAGYTYLVTSTKKPDSKITAGEYTR
jgi:uncharacterized caspase-like protein